MPYWEIPKLLHFIWIGGVTPDEHLDNIARWRHMNPEYRVILWFDSRNMLANTLRKKVQKAGLAGEREAPPFYRRKQEGANFGTDQGRIQTIQAMRAKANPGAEEKNAAYYQQRAEDKERMMLQKCLLKQVPVRDLRAELGQCSNIAIYDLELANQYPNVSAVSDVMRLELVIRHGGIYLDVDVACIRTLPTVRVRSDLARFGVWEPYGVNNAVMGACPGSEFLIRCRGVIRSNYGQLSASVDQELQEYYRRAMRSWAVKKTGPSVASEELKKMEDEHAYAGGQTAAAYANAAAWIRDECQFPQGFFNYATEAAKVHKWLPPAAAADGGHG